MSDTSSKGERSFKNNTGSLFDELSLAFEWERPSLLLAVTRSRIGFEKASQALQLRLEAAGYPVKSVQINEANPDVAVTLLAAERPSQSVFFVSGLERGGGEDGQAAFHALNFSRELFVEHELKVVFWLTPNEAAILSRLAPDFWAFRHRVIEYASPAPHLPPEMLGRLLLWPGDAMPASPALLDEKIHSLEATLAALPLTPEALGMRIETWFLLGHARWSAGDEEAAFKALVAGMGLAQDRGFAQLTAWLLCGVSILRYRLGRHQEALEIFQDLASHDPNDGLVGMNVAVALCSVGKNSEGLRQGARAVLKERSAARLWNVLGHLKLALGKFDEALDCFQKAVSLNAASAEYRESLAACYKRMERGQEALEQIQAAGRLQEAPYDRTRILALALQSEFGEASRLLSEALSAGQITEAAIKNDANLNLILDPARIAED